MKNFQCSKQRSLLGFSGIELLLSLSVLVIAFTILTSALSQFRGGGLLAETEATMRGIVHDARVRTLGSESNNQYGVHFETTKIVLFVGGTYDASANTNEVYSLPVGVRISSVALLTGNEIVFARLTGLPSTTGDIVIQLTRDPAQTKTISILSSGIIE